MNQYFILYVNIFKELSLNVTFGEELISNKNVKTSGHLFVPSSSIYKNQ
jgi:hypothetical protein